jgi:hypothetical protein
MKPGRDPDGIAQIEGRSFRQLPGRAAFLDMRDLGQVLAHVHDADIVSRSAKVRRAAAARRAPLQ